GPELGELCLLLGEEAARLQLEERREEDEELAARLEVELVALGEPRDEGDDDLRQVELGERQLLAEDEREQEVERTLEGVEVELELADGDGGHCGRLSPLADAPAWDGHLRPRGRRTPPPPRLHVPAAALHPDESSARDDEADDRDPGVQAQAGEVVRGVDAQELLEEAPEAVVGDVEAEEPRRP